MYLVSSARSFISTSVKCGKAATVVTAQSEAVVVPTCMYRETTPLRYKFLCNLFPRWALNSTNRRRRCGAFIQLALSC